MLNDVHAPPMEPKNAASKTAVHRSIRERPKYPTAPAGNRPGDRAHSLEKQADHHGGTNLVFTEPEDRGDVFNTSMSAIIVSGVLVTLVVTAVLMWK